jgi:hypothetical protein
MRFSDDALFRWWVTFRQGLQEKELPDPGNMI